MNRTTVLIPGTWMVMKTHYVTYEEISATGDPRNIVIDVNLTFDEAFERVKELSLTELGYFMKQVESK